MYTQAEHRIERSRLDPDALRIVERLRAEGHEAYIVGGAVRDMLLGRSPKDFDIVTSAEPARIKRIFRSARVIGRRFRLVHVYAGSKIFEVSTFRSIANGTIGNEYGTMDEDALRRDFTLNALYFDPHDSTLVDYVGGFKDMAAKCIRPVIALKTIFKEDPVRMIRCVKYAAMAGFRIPFSLRLALKRDSQLLASASPSRLTEEFLKILASGSSTAILKGLLEFGLLRHIAPASAALAASGTSYKSALEIALAELDDEASDPSREKRLALLLAHYLKPFLDTRPERFVDTPEAYREAVHESRLFLAPLNPPRVELEAAVLVVFKRRGVSPLQKPKRPPGGDRVSRPGDRRVAGRKDEPGQKAEGPVEASETAKRRRRRPRRRKVSGGGGPASPPSVD
ncbi:MAG: polynucleotide adenylyltransferase PcnB [Rectinemataceae bacterium]